MLESMIENARPTRAEVSDVSNAVFGGADAVMLSAETAAGQFPVPAVQMMDRVARQVEGYQWTTRAFDGVDNGDPPPPMPLYDAVARSTALLSRDLRGRGIVVLSKNGTTARVVSAARPAAPVIAMTMDPATCRRMSLLWGVLPVKVEPADLDRMHDLARQLVRQFGLADDGFIRRVAGLGSASPAITVLRL